MLFKKDFIAHNELILSMVFLGSTLVIGKNLIASFPVFLLLSLRFLIGTACFSMRYFLSKLRKRIVDEKLTKKDWCLLFLQSLFGAFFFNLFMLLGLRSTTADNAAILTSTIPIFITIFSFLILKEHISRYKFVAIILSILGLILVTANANHITISQPILSGNFLILLAVITGALFPICVKLSSNNASIQLISLTFNLFGLVLFLPLAINDAIQFDFHSIHFNVWLLVIFYSLAANVLYLHFWNKGLTVVPASTASLFTAVMPLSTAILAYIFLNETFTMLQIVGTICVMAAIIVGVYSA